MRDDSRTYGLLNGHSPLAEDVVCIDFDGTLYPWGDLFSYDPPLPGAVDAVKQLKASGYRIVIFTSRLSPTWLYAEHESAAQQMSYIEEVLKRDGIPYDDITCEKVPAVAYVDDKAIAFRPGFDFAEGQTWGLIATHLISKKAK